jgi:hypothetical protein
MGDEGMGQARPVDDAHGPAVGLDQMVRWATPPIFMTR